MQSSLGETHEALYAPEKYKKEEIKKNVEEIT